MGTSESLNNPGQKHKVSYSIVIPLAFGITTIQVSHNYLGARKKKEVQLGLPLSEVFSEVL